MADTLVQRIKRASEEAMLEYTRFCPHDIWQKWLTCCKSMQFCFVFNFHHSPGNPSSWPHPNHNHITKQCRPLKFASSCPWPQPRWLLSLLRLASGPGVAEALELCSNCCCAQDERIARACRDQGLHNYLRERTRTIEFSPLQPAWQDSSPSSDTSRLAVAPWADSVSAAWECCYLFEASLAKRLFMHITFGKKDELNNQPTEWIWGNLLKCYIYHYLWFCLPQ